MNPNDVQITFELERLERLHTSGTINENEFETLKAKLLQRFSESAPTHPDKPASLNAAIDVSGLNLKSHQLIGFGGALAVILGCFAPLVHLPIVGSVNYIFNGRGDGIFVLALAIAAAAFVFFRKYRALAFSALAITAVCSFTYIKFAMVLADIHNSIDASLQGNPFRGIADAFVTAVGLDWAWPLLIVGIVLLLVSSVLGTRFEGSKDLTG
jgi:hypothetical protein